MHKQDSRDRVLRWIARIWSLPAIIFILGEFIFPHGGDGHVPFVEWLSVGLLVTAVIGLAFAWRWEIFGSTVSLLALLGSFLLLGISRETIFWEVALLWFGFIAAPAIMFLACGIRARPPDLKPA